MVGCLAYTTAAIWHIYPRYARVQLTVLVASSTLLVADGLFNILRSYSNPKVVLAANGKCRASLIY